MRILVFLFLTACGGAIAEPLDVCAEIDAATNDAGACTFTPTHPPICIGGKLVTNDGTALDVNACPNGVSVVSESDSSVSWCCYE